MQDTYSLRGLCMLMIIIHHVFKVDPNCPINIMRWGYLGVAVFFFLSGWGLYCSMQKNIDWTYFKRNIKKLVIPYVIAWALAELICFARFPQDITLLSSFADLFRMGYRWFIKVILVVYLITIPTFILVKHKITRLAIISVCSIVYYIAAWKFFNLPLYRFATTPCFMLGMWAAAYQDKFKYLFKVKNIILILAIIIYILTLKLNFLQTPPRIIHATAFSIMLIFLVSVVNIANPFLDYIGRNSLLFYLFHLDMCELILPPPGEASSIPLSTLYVIFSCTLAICLLYNWIKSKIEKYLQ